MISVVIPSYNHEKYILKTLESIAEDSFEDKEIVIIDDGSTDSSDKLISEWVEKNKDRVLITYKHRANKGLNATLNELLSLAKGEYIVLMGSDDYLLEGGLKKRYDYFKSHPQTKVLIGDAILIDGDDNKLYDSMLFDFREYKREQFRDPKSIKKTLFKRFVLAGPIYMVKKDFYDEIGGYDESFLAEDLDFCLRALAKDEMSFLDEKVCAYRIHDTNQSLAGITPRLLRDSAKAFWKNMHLYPMREKPIMMWNIFKFLVREFLLRLGLRK